MRTEVRYRLPYSIDRSMRDTGRDVEHVEHRYVVRVIYDRARLTPLLESVPDKTICLRIYGILTAEFREKPVAWSTMSNQPEGKRLPLDARPLVGRDGHVGRDPHLVGRDGTPHETGHHTRAHRQSPRRRRRARRQRLLERGDREWIDKFCVMLERIAEGEGDIHFMEGVADALYAEDITVYDAAGTPTRLPQHATALDCAFERGVGEKAHLCAHRRPFGFARHAPRTRQLCRDFHRRTDAPLRRMDRRGQDLQGEEFPQSLFPPRSFGRPRAAVPSVGRSPGRK